MGFIAVPVALFIVLPVLEEDEEKRISTKWCFAVFRLVSNLKHFNDGFDRSRHASICCLATYFYV